MQIAYNHNLRLQGGGRFWTSDWQRRARKAMIRARLMPAGPANAGEWLGKGSSMRSTRRDGDTGGDQTRAAPLPALRRLLTLLYASYGRRDLGLMLGLGAAASLAEGAGLLLLVPVLAAMQHHQVKP